MENKFMNEKEVLDDDLLENVSGGWLITEWDNTDNCDMCNQKINRSPDLKYNNGYLCESCMAKIKNP